MTLVLVVAAIAILIAALCPRPADAAAHRFFIEKEQAYNGMLRSDIPPVLTVRSGDTVVFNTVMLMGGALSPHMTFDEMFAVRTRMRDQGLGTYAFTGPFFVEGAEPGDALQVDILRIRPGEYAVTHIYPDSPRGSRRGGSSPCAFRRTGGPSSTPRASSCPSAPSLGPWPWLPGLARSCPRPSLDTSPATWTTKSSSPGRRSSSR